VLLLCLLIETRPANAQGSSVQILDANNEPLTTLIDGNAIALKISLAQAVSVDTPVEFTLAEVATPIATCTIPTGQTSCQTERFSTFGWAWSDTPSHQETRRVEAQSADLTLGQSRALVVTARPVVMVHGFGAEWQVWATYLGADGFLATNGLRGFAVDDG